MATALETTSQQRTPSPPASLVFASVAGAVYVFASLAVVLYAVPHLWREYVGLHSFIGDMMRMGLQIAAALGLGWLGRNIAGANPPKGLRGGIFLVISVVITIFFLVRAVGLNVEGMPGMLVTAAIGAALIIGAVRFFASPRATRWMIGLEETGLFHTTSYKKTLGHKVRRLTILGLLILGLSGVYALYSQGVLGKGDWSLELPFTDTWLTLLTDKQTTIPLLLSALTLWVAVRAVNMPTFAEFLIATEAEMNKVSWSTRRQLVQDTLVVLITVFLMTVFLLVVDLFWGWLLSLPVVGVLPSKVDTQKKQEQQEVRW